MASHPVAIENLRKNWECPNFQSPASGKQGSVCILVLKTCFFSVMRWKKDFSGCILSLLISFEDLLFNLINVYTPTDINERNIFLGGIACFFFTF